MAQLVTLGDNKEELSKSLGLYIQSGDLNFLLGSGASRPAIQVAGTIEKEINALLLANKHAEADLKCLDFLEAITGVHAGFLNDPIPAAVASTLDQYARFIELIDSILFLRKNLLLPRQANIFTTNYDLFLEQSAARQPGLVLNDGFDRSAPAGTSFPFAPERYFDRTYRSGSIYRHQNEVPTINLFKLHGSMTWKKNENQIVFGMHHADFSAKDRTDSKKVSSHLEQFALILPNMQKFQSTLIDRIYYDLLRFFANALDRGNAVLLSLGFSFDDEHILDITRRSLRNPTAQLIIAAYDKAAVESYKVKFAKHRNVIIIAPAAGTTISFAELNELLSSVLPVVKAGSNAA